VVTRRSAPDRAYVLHRHDWSETSLILELFCRDQGRIVVAAKGAKRPYSQLRSVLLPFQQILVTLGRPPKDEQAEIVTLRGAEWAGGLPMIAGGALFPGFYLNELLLKLLARGDPHPAVFDAYAATLGSLDVRNDLLTQAALRAFEFVLLRELGHLPVLDRFTATQERPDPDEPCALHPEIGLREAQPEEPALSGRRWLAIQQALDAQALGELQQVCLDGLRPLRDMLRSVLHYHLGQSPLRTRRVMLDAQQLLER